MIELSSFGRNVWLDVSYVLFNALTDYFVSNNSVEKDIEFDDYSFEVVFLVSIFFSHKETIFFFKNVLDLANNVRSPNNFPIFFRVKGFFVKTFLEIIQQKHWIWLS